MRLPRLTAAAVQRPRRAAICVCRRQSLLDAPPERLRRRRSRPPDAPGPAGRRSDAQARAAAWNFLLRSMVAGKIGPLPEKFGRGQFVAVGLTQATNLVTAALLGVKRRCGNRPRAAGLQRGPHLRVVEAAAARQARPLRPRAAAAEEPPPPPKPPPSPPGPGAAERPRAGRLGAIRYRRAENMAKAGPTGCSVGGSGPTTSRPPSSPADETARPTPAPPPPPRPHSARRGTGRGDDVRPAHRRAGVRARHAGRRRGHRPAGDAWHTPALWLVGVVLAGAVSRTSSTSATARPPPGRRRAAAPGALGDRGGRPTGRGAPKTGEHAAGHPRGSPGSSRTSPATRTSLAPATYCHRRPARDRLAGPAERARRRPDAAAAAALRGAGGASGRVTGRGASGVACPRSPGTSSTWFVARPHWSCTAGPPLSRQPSAG